MHEQGAFFGEGVDPSGLRVFTVGHLRPRGVDDGLEDDEGGPLSAYPPPSQQQQQTSNGAWEDIRPHAPSQSYQDASGHSRPTTAPAYHPPADASFPSSSNYASRPTTGGAPNGYQSNPNSNNPNLTNQSQDFDTRSTPSNNSSLPTSTSTSNSNSFASSSTASSSYNSSARRDSVGTRPPGTLRVRRSTYVPGWSVAPRVLIVEDDAVIRKMSTKLLEVAGCTIDVAVDGVEAVNQMNLSKYDLVLMVSFSSFRLFDLILSRR